jgi:hypothetical protein
MSRIEAIQRELSAARLERARLRLLTKELDAKISDLEYNLNEVEVALAVLGPDSANRIGSDAVASALGLKVR